MPKLVETKSRISMKPTEAVCKNCERTLPIDMFYSNKGWEANDRHDGWCKDCFSAISTKDGVRKYFYYNHRKWKEEIWDNIEKKARDSLAEVPIYKASSQDKQYDILAKTVCSKLPLMMNIPTYYEYDDMCDSGKYSTYEEFMGRNPIQAEQYDDVDENKKFYSKEFNGYFKKSELEYLENYYAQLEVDFSFDTENRRDYARKVCKASLQADRAQDDYSAGRCDYSVVKDAMALFDTLSKSANFAACKRDPGESNGIGSWAELTLALETSGHPCTRKIEWEKDDVDRTIEEYRHIVEAINIDGV